MFTDVYKSLGVQSQRQQGFTGKGIKVGILDTGKSAQHKVTSMTEKETDHATKVTGVINNIAFDSELYVGQYIEWEKSLEFFYENGVDIVNMSYVSGNEITDRLEKIEELIDYYTEKGIIFVAATGNSEQETINYPAQFKNVISVGGIDKQTLNPIHWATTGPKMELVSIGRLVNTIDINGEKKWATGTSYASPQLAGIIALLQDRAKQLYGRLLTLNEVRAILHMRATYLSDECGYGFFTFGNHNEVKMQVGNKQYEVNGQAQEMDTEPFIQDDRTFVPIRFVAEALGYEVDYHEGEIIIKG